MLSCWMSLQTDWIRQLIEQEKERGALILLASHNQDDMKILADQVYKIADGRIERKGTEL